MPPLRERSAVDILLLARTFLSRLAHEHGTPVPKVSSAAQQALTSYDWPGNVRELQNAVHRAYVLCEDRILELEDLPPRLFPKPAASLQPSSLGVGLAGQSSSPFQRSETGRLPAVSLDVLERRAIEEALDRNRWNLSAVGRQLGIGRTTLYRKLKKYGLK